MTKLFIRLRFSSKVLLSYKAEFEELAQKTFRQHQNAL